jgi:hypothetical protein
MNSAGILERPVLGEREAAVGLARSGAGSAGQARPRIVLLSSQLLTDRMLLYSEWGRRLARSAELQIWTTAATHPAHSAAWHPLREWVRTFPETRPLREFPFSYLRRLNELIWDFRLRPPSRMSTMRRIRDKNWPLGIRALKLPARAFAALRFHRPFESALERLLLTYNRSPEAARRLREWRPDAVVCTDPFSHVEPAVINEAKRLGIPTLGIVTSWDNLSTKNRMVYRYDGYVLWSEQMRRDLHCYYPQARTAEVQVVGAPQFDVFRNPLFAWSREQFCRVHGLEPDRPIIVYALGSPNFLKEWHGALRCARRLRDGAFGRAQLIVRPHPMFFRHQDVDAFEGLGEGIVLQRTADPALPTSKRTQHRGDVELWVNTFAHADVVVNLSSTVTVDAALFDRPIVNLDFDPEPGRPNQELVREVNHTWTHFKPIAESGGVWLVNDWSELERAVRGYLADPALHREGRKWIAEYVCGLTDGRCGERMADAIVDFAARQRITCRRGAPGSGIE